MHHHLVLCYNSSCPQHTTCLRFSEPRTEWVEFHDFTPEAGRCDHYIAVPAEVVNDKKEEAV